MSETPVQQVRTGVVAFFAAHPRTAFFAGVAVCLAVEVVGYLAVSHL